MQKEGKKNCILRIGKKKKSESEISTFDNYYTKVMEEKQ